MRSVPPRGSGWVLDELRVLASRKLSERFQELVHQRQTAELANYAGVDVVLELIARNRELYATERRTFAVMNITRDRLPAADAILCRECFIHLSLRNITAAIRNFQKTGATHLLCTTHPKVTANTDCADGGWRSLNLQLKPFDFPAPVKLLVEDEELGKCLGVWRLQDL